MWRTQETQDPDPSPEPEPEPTIPVESPPTSPEPSPLPEPVEMCTESVPCFVVLEPFTLNAFLVGLALALLLLAAILAAQLRRP